ncbi:hypothetical protein [Arthrobacter sp. VKM Ac-2550]|uniref:hypothetical protein n=1 Tax=Crystallibacter permensis TaxID=1938888 RepID=UPI00222612ED|nr:hypothetical protein [Arthrobacter sp. VKM Ac-2550]MCW2131683.1 hypothetical protein [Arthrobacter sp. VKM Ac-2550]
MTIPGTGQPTVDLLNGLRPDGEVDVGRNGATFRLRELPLKTGVTLMKRRTDGQPADNVVTAILISGFFVHRGSLLTSRIV